MKVSQLILGQAVALDLQPPGATGNDFLVYFSLLLLRVVPAVVALGLFLVLKHARSRKTASDPTDAREKRSFQPLIFSPPGRWLAIKNGNAPDVLAALGLHNPTPCSWEDGLSAAPEHKLFISPPVTGWTLVLGSELPDPAQDVDECFRFVVELSRKLGQVQFFSANRSINAHAWVHASHGRIIRAYAWAGKTVWNQGKITAMELELGLKCFDYGEAPERANFARSEPHRSNAEKVSHLAGCWSVDPTSIDARTSGQTLGIVGERSHSRHR